MGLRKHLVLIKCIWFRTPTYIAALLLLASVRPTHSTKVVVVPWWAGGGIESANLCASIPAPSRVWWSVVSGDNNIKNTDNTAAQKVN